MSSRYFARIHAERATRRRVLLSGTVLAGAGGIALAGVPAAWPLRVLLELAWCAVCGLELWWRWRRHRRVLGYRLHADGSVDIESADGACAGGTLAPGTVSLASLAWLRCRAADGRVYAELVCRNKQERDDWRRFRVICRHVSAC